MEIDITLDSLSQALNIFNKEELNSEFMDYIENKCHYKFFNSKLISLNIKGLKKEEQQNFREIVHKTYSDKLNYLNKIDTYDDYFRFILLIIGTIAILISERFVSFLSELFLIAGWVVIWEIIYDILFSGIKRKRNKIIFASLSKAKVNFRDGN